MLILQRQLSVAPQQALVARTSAILIPQPLTAVVRAGTVAIGYEIVSTITNLSRITMVGGVTGRTYVSDTVFVDGPPQPVLIDPADTTVTCTVTPANVLFAVPAVDFIVWLSPVATRQAPAALVPKPFDWTVSGEFTNGPAFLVAPVGPSGTKTVLAAYAVSAKNTGAVAYSAAVTFVDIVPTQVWKDGVGHGAVANQADHASESHLSISSTVINSTLTMSLNINPPISEFVDMSMGGWYL